MSEWVDFKAVKAAVTMQMVLDHYGIENLRKTGNELRGPCPIHKGSAQSKNFGVNILKNAFKCFSKECGAHGNVLEFVSLMEGCSVRDAALKLECWFGIGDTGASSAEEREVSDAAPKISRGIYSDQTGALFEVVTNAISGEGLEALVVYRELFGDYRFLVAPPRHFGESDALFTLIKAL